MKIRNKQKNENLVYSSEFGRMCPACGRPADGCLCRESKSTPLGDGIVRVRRETQGRRGKGVTLITGLPLAPDALKTLGKRLKAQCATGGTVKDGLIEIQGDHRDAVIRILEKEGWTVKRSGG